MVLLWWSEDNFQELVSFYHGVLIVSSPDPSLERTDRGTVVSLPEVEHVHSAGNSCVVPVLKFLAWEKGGL